MGAGHHSGGQAESRCFRAGHLAPSGNGGLHVVLIDATENKASPRKRDIDGRYSRIC